MQRRRTPLAALIAAALFTAGAGALTQKPPEATVAAPAAERIELTGRQVPYAIRAAALLDAIAGLEAEGASATMIASLGFTPESTAGSELRSAARDFAEATSHDEIDALLGPGARSMSAADARRRLAQVDEHELAAAQRAAETGRHRAAGEQLGSWLRARRAEGRDLDALLGQLLDRDAVGVKIGTTDSQLDYAALASLVTAFEDGVRSTLGFLPQRLASVQEVDDAN